MGKRQKKYMNPFWGSVAVWMSERLEQCKEVVEVMTRKVVEFLETNMGMVEDNLGQVGNNLEEAWRNTLSVTMSLLFR